LRARITHWKGLDERGRWKRKGREVEGRLGVVECLHRAGIVEQARLSIGSVLFVDVYLVIGRVTQRATKTQQRESEIERDGKRENKKRVRKNNANKH
jgi:hypothetical protein